MSINLSIKMTLQACLYLGLSTTGCALAQSEIPMADNQSPLREYLESAWMRSSAQAELQAKKAEAEAYKEQADGWRSSASSLVLTYQTDQSSSSKRDGFEEYELAVSTPVWGITQRQKRQGIANKKLQANSTQIELSRLELAGQVRSRYWDAASKNLIHEELQDHIEHARQTEALVQKRVEAGDLATSDLLLAQQQVLQSEVELQRSEALAQEAQSEFEALTGMPWRNIGFVPIELSATAPHPVLAHLQALIASQRAKMAMPVESSEVTPKIGLLVRQESDDFTAVRQRLGVQLDLPLGTDVINTPAKRALESELAALQAQLVYENEAITKRVESAKRSVGLQRKALSMAEDQLALTQQHLQMVQTAFDLGEMGLVELLRSIASVHIAKISQMQQGVNLARAISTLNQNKGLLP